MASAGTLALPALARNAQPGLDVFGEVYRERELALEAAIAKQPQIKARLSANENPWGPSEKAKKALIKAIDTSFLYAGPATMELRKKLADMNGVPEDHILLGAGSSELLMASLMLYGPKGKIIMGDPCYISNRDDNGDSGSMNLDKVPLTKEYQYDLDAMVPRVGANTSMVYICNPNNPTGVILPAGKLRDYCGSISAKTPVLVDEAYIDYAKDPKTESMINCVQKGQNVIILRTLSKLHAFAGLRVGYAIAQPATINQLKKYASGGFSLSGTSVAAAIASLADTDFQQYTLKQTAASKQFLYDFLTAQDYTYLPSSANFVLFPLRMKGQPFLAKMMDEGVSVRSWEFDRQHWCRVSIGTMGEMKTFANAFQKVIS
jgi:histidinol-phosphate aminotransferase